MSHLWYPFTPMLEWDRESQLVIDRGEGNYLIDQQGNRYLDGVSSLWVTVHGHTCDAIRDAVHEQLDRLPHSTLLGLTHQPAIDLAARLVRLAPKGLTRVFFSDSGSTAVEIALKQAFQFWSLRGRPERRRFIHLEAAYHGDTLGAVGVGGIELFHRIFGALVVAGIPAPNPCADPHLEGVTRVLERHAGEVAAVIVEPLVQGAAGMLVHPTGYLAKLARLCRDQGVLLIADEVATGFGRTGTLFACEQEGVTPDFLCLAKGLSGGYLPLAATLTREAIYEAFLGERIEYRTFFHGHTFTGNPLACAAANASIDLFEARGLLTHVQAMSEILGRLLAEEIRPLPGVREIRQKGLMIGIELGPFPVEQFRGNAVCRAARKRGVLLRPLGDVVVWMPPLSIDEPDARLLSRATREAILEVCADAASS